MRDNYSVRTYREWHRADDLAYFVVRFKETDLHIGVDRKAFTPAMVADVERLVQRLRGELEAYIALYPVFRTSLEPLELVGRPPSLAVEMAESARLAGVGPMAAVAGAFAERVGKYLEGFADNVVVENGGDLYINSKKARLVAVMAGKSPFSNRIAIEIQPEESPLGLCTSSGTVGPSLSFGTADAAVIKATPASLADAVATGAGNLVHDKENLMPAIEYARSIPGVSGVLVIKDDRMAAWGNIKLVPV